MAGLNSTFDDDPRRYDALRDCWLNDRREGFLRERLSRLDRDETLRVLEIGSGTGWLLTRLAKVFPHWQFVGIEPIPRYVAYASERNASENLRFLEGSAETPPAELIPGEFDILLSNDVLHHVSSQQEAVRQAARLAKTGARWIVIEPNALNPYAFAGQSLKPGERNFWPQRFTRMAGPAGWRLRSKEYLFLIPPFIVQPPSWMATLESALEGIPFLGGGVSLEFIQE